MEKNIWFPFSDEPLIDSHFYVPAFSSPAVVMPENAPDGAWHIFLHSWLGIHHFKSDSGIAWEPKKLVVARGHYPFVFSDGGRYYLVYENHEPENINDSFKRFGHRKYCSRIQIISSENLVKWSHPKTVLSAEDVPYSSDYTGRPCLTSPSMIKRNDGTFRLYFSAADMVLPVGKTEKKENRRFAPRFFGYAEALSLDEKFLVPGDSLLLEAQPDSKYSNLSPGNIRIVSHNDVIYGFMCSYYWDEKNYKASSAVMLLKSEDGLKFSSIGEKPILGPQTEGWASRFIKTCDVKYKSEEDCWYLYFSASGDKKDVLHLWEREGVGLFIGNEPKDSL